MAAKGAAAKLLRMASHEDRPACGLCSTEIRGLSVRRGGREVLRDVSLRFHCGEATVLIGRNGAGKSTLLKAMIGEIPSSGRILFHAEGGGRFDRPSFGYVPQAIMLDPGSPITVADLFAASRSRRPVWAMGRGGARAACEAALARTGAERLVDKGLGRLSGGELQRVLLAYALEPLPDILLLDEPVSGIDHAGMRDFYGLLSEIRRAHDLAIVMVSHDFDLAAAIADRVVFLEGGAVACSGSPAEVFAHPAVVEAFGELSIGSGARP